MIGSSKIDVTMTATLRPDIVRRTLKSYCKNILQERDRFRFILNVDPVGENVKPEEVVNVCKKFFPTVIYNIAKEPSFPRAVIWTWKQVKSDFVFHLEDDWLLDRFVDINHMIRILIKHKELACLRLCKYNIKNKKVVHIFRSRYTHHEDGFYIAQDQRAQFGLNPVLIKSEFVRKAVPLMVVTRNPEKQFRWGNTKMRDHIMKWRYAIYGNPGDRALAIDNGYRWRKTLGFDKPTPEEGPFLVWKKK